jgi:hypothetical protein
MPRKSDIKQIDRICKKLRLTRGQRRLLHDEIAGQNYGLDEIRQMAREIKKLHPNK